MTEDLLFMYKNFENKASMCDDWKKCSITDLANRYCDADEIGDEDSKEVYLSAIMCKYWYMVPYMYNKSKTTKLSITDITGWLYDGLMLGFKYRRWRDPNYSVNHMEDGAKTVFNRCFDTIRERYYTEINRNKNKVNYGEVVSLESMFDEYGDLVESWKKENMTTNDSFSKSRSDLAIDYYIKNNKILPALVIDSICCQDTTSKRRVKNKSSDSVSYHSCDCFNETKIVDFLHTADDNFYEYFKNHYSVDGTLINKYAIYIKSLSYDKLKNKIDDALDEIRNNKEVKNIVCC